MTSQSLGQTANIYGCIFDSISLVTIKLDRIIDQHVLALAS